MIIFIIASVQSLDVQLINLQQVYYSVPITANNFTYNLIVDTGSDTLWIFGKQNDRRKYYECNKCQAIMQKRLDYGLGSIYGTQFTQLFEFGNQSLNLSVVEVERVQDLESLIADGIIGLSKQYPDSDANLIDLLYNHTIIDVKQFGLLLSDQICSANSLLTLGKPNPSNYVGQLHYVNTTRSDLWNVYANSVLVSNDTHQYMLESNKQLILFDSGTSKIMLSTRKFHSLHNIFNDDYNLHCEQVKHNYFHELVCHYTTQFPHLILNINSQLNLTLLPQDYISYCGYNYFLQYRCYLNFQNLDNDDEIILGVVFLQKYYTHYDLEAKKVGIAQSIYYSRDKVSLGELGNQYNYNMLYLSLMSVPILMLVMILSLNIIRMKQTADEIAQSNEGGRQSRGQEQEMEPITFSVQSVR
ncbi:unnamed protein product (macronuclear) [Paramecium tetraurelia]|uniref:Peptidase A1 domain-containing protein n=1 Tax=Paramecium tetraurelia TaxID=5888 RepID=A0C6Z2_PARTE|nr:uncharacterized protein GSPATT00035688001 [Paramecium tetraurelia]CAK66559.1 unnamed protein product [Paramecium tetraurelia]|eukprot:XP_001433956.1 hypothetical protein (macronuclear) [Paramecium tetraurelia strain d4-2]